MMAEINRDVLRSIILDVLQEMGGVHEAPQFKAVVLVKAQHQCGT